MDTQNDQSIEPKTTEEAAEVIADMRAEDQAEAETQAEVSLPASGKSNEQAKHPTAGKNGGEEILPTGGKNSLHDSLEKQAKDLQRDFSKWQARAGNAEHWERLRAEDPARWAADRQDLMEEKRQLDDRARQVREAATATRIAEEQHQRAEALERLTGEQKKLAAAIQRETGEAWNDDTKTEMVNYLTGLGFTRQELDSVQDHRVAVVIRKAMLYDKGKPKRGIKVKVKPKPDDVAETMSRHNIRPGTMDEAALRLQRGTTRAPDRPAGHTPLRDAASRVARLL